MTISIYVVMYTQGTLPVKEFPILKLKLQIYVEFQLVLIKLQMTDT